MNLFAKSDIIPGGGGKVLLGEYISGAQFPFRITITDTEDNPINISAWTVTAKCKYYLGTVTGTKNSLDIKRETVAVHDPVIPDLTLTVTKLTQSGDDVGRMNILIPHDLYPNIVDPLGDNVPICALFLKLDNGASPSEINIQRINLIVRFGG